MAETFLVVLISLLVLYVLFVVWLLRSGRLAKWDLSLMLGIVLMQRTHRGKGTIDFIARPRRLWNLIGDFGIVLTLVGMVAITIFFLWTVWLALQPDSGVPALSVQEIFVIPGVNPFVPLWYGLAALIVTLVVHEGGHGVLARANGMKLKSLGLLWLVVPIGAFVEPEELDLKVAPRRARLRVFGAGPAVNVGFAALSVTLFAILMGSLTPAAGAWVGTLSRDAAGNPMPAELAGIEPGDIVVAADGRPIDGWEGLTAFLNGTRPGQEVTFGLERGTEATLTLRSAWSTLPGGLQHNITGTDAASFAACRDPERAESMATGTCLGVAVCLANLQPHPTTGPECAERLQGKSRAGITTITPEQLAFLGDPFVDNGRGLAMLAALPLAEVLGQQPVLTVYAPAFHATPFHESTFWILANLAFWIFWINLMVGITNILPMLPLDGGHIFREAVGGAFAWVRPGMAAERRDKLVAGAAAFMSLLILGAFIIQIVAPHIVR